MMRLVRQAAAALAGLAVPLAGVAVRAGAQAPRRALPAACVVPAERVEWAVQPLYAMLGPLDSLQLRLPVPVYQLMLDDITTRLRARLMPPGDSTAAASLTVDRLPVADSLYGTGVLLSHLHFTLYGNGNVANLYSDSTHAVSMGEYMAPFAPSPGDTLFNAHLREAVERAAAEGGGIGPFSDRGMADSTRLVLHVVTPPPGPMADTTIALWPLFRMNVPLDRSPAPWKGPNVDYPEGARRGGYQATVLMQFVLDETGRPVASTIKPVRKPADVPPALESVYEEFILAVRRGIERARYRPAETLGCRIRHLVQQPFVFGFR